MGKVLSRAVLDGLAALSKKVDVGILAIGDKNGYPIVFTSHLETLLGYSPGDLDGKTFARLLPLSIRGRHKALMEGFKKQLDSGISRDMTPGRAVKGLHKDGTEVDLSIAISYHPALLPDERGVFLALIQDPLNMKANDRQLKDLRIGFNDLVYSGQQMGRRAGKAIAAKITASGGILGFIVWLMSQVTPLGTAIKSFAAAWNWKAANPSVSDIQISAAVNDRSRIKALQEIRDNLRKSDTRVVAAGYYEFIFDVAETQLQYFGDSASASGEEVWFFDRSQRKLILTPDELHHLELHECIFRTKAANYPGRKDSPYLNMVLCPTFRIGQTNGIRRLELANVLAIAVEPDFTAKDMEPISTRLWTFGPAVENFIK